MTYRILVTGAGALLGQGIIRALQCGTLSVEIIGADPSLLSAGLYWADRGYCVPLARDEAYLARLKEIIARERPHAVLVGTDVELPTLSRHRTALEEEFGTQVLVSDQRVVAIADDKYETAEFFKAEGFDYPLSAREGEEERLIEKVGFPLIVKPRIGARAIGLSIVRSRRELCAALEGRTDLVIQECIGTPDHEYTAGSIVFGGVCHATIVMRRDLRDGNTYRAYVEDFPELRALVARWAEALNAHGPANFQFRVDKEGRAKVFEINSRFSGTTPLRTLAGYNEVEMCLRHLLNGEPVMQPTIEPMTILRHWSETVVRATDLERIG